MQGAAGVIHGHVADALQRAGNLRDVDDHARSIAIRLVAGQQAHGGFVHFDLEVIRQAIFLDHAVAISTLRSRMA
jgi:hypothetical protein